VRTSKDEGWNITTRYDYDNNGAQTSRVLTGASGTPREQNWTYFPDGKQRSQSDNGAGTAQPRKDFRFEYDPSANLTRMLDQSTDAKIDAYAVSYDQLNRVASVEEKLGSTIKNTTTYEYEPNDLLKRRTHDRQISEYSYETERDLVTEIKKKTTSADTSPKTTTYSYTSRGETRTETKGNKNVVTKEYNLDGSVLSNVEKKADGTVVNQHTYEYTANGHKAKDNARKQNADNKSAYLDTTSTFEYDPQDRIRKVTKTGNGAGTESYVHDNNSNVIDQTVGGTRTTFAYDKNRLTSASAQGVGVFGCGEGPASGCDGLSSSIGLKAVVLLVVPLGRVVLPDCAGDAGQQENIAVDDQRRVLGAPRQNLRHGRQHVRDAFVNEGVLAHMEVDIDPIVGLPYPEIPAVAHGVVVAMIP
jgi:hypothetical protein